MMVVKAASLYHVKVAPTLPVAVIAAMASPWQYGAGDVAFGAAGIAFTVMVTGVAGLTQVPIVWVT